MPPLKNQQHELFCLALMSGMSQAAAARCAGYSPICARQTAITLLTYNDIIKRRAELSALTEGNTIMTVEERNEKLSTIAREAVKQPVTAREVVQSIAELNKLGGDYPAEKVKHSGTVILKMVLDREPAQITEGE